MSACCRRPSSTSYSMVSMSPFAPSLLQMEVSNVEDELGEAGAGAGAGSGAGGAGAWYSAPEGLPRDDSCGAHSFEPDETAEYFHFFRGLYSDYQELAPTKQRFALYLPSALHITVSSISVELNGKLKLKFLEQN